MSFKEYMSQKLEEASRPIFISDDGRLKYSVIKNMEYSEWQARAYIDGKYNEAKTIFTGDGEEYKQEAISGAQDGIKRWNALTPEQKEKDVTGSIKFSNKIEKDHEKSLKNIERKGW